MALVRRNNFLIFFLLILLSFCSYAYGSTTLKVDDFGAKGDGTSNDTQVTLFFCRTNIIVI